jgi:hypothetical protein
VRLGTFRDAPKRSRIGLEAAKNFILDGLQLHYSINSGLPASEITHCRIPGILTARASIVVSWFQQFLHAEALTPEFAKVCGAVAA